MWEIPLTVALLSGAFLYAQDRHYRFKTQSQAQAGASMQSDQLEKTLRDFEEYKKRVDALTLRAGFKL